MNVAVGVPELIATDAGENVPPAPPSLGVTVTVPVMPPFAPTVNGVDATPTAPLDGPERVTDVAGPAVSRPLPSRCHSEIRPLVPFAVGAVGGVNPEV